MTITNPRAAVFREIQTLVSEYDDAVLNATIESSLDVDHELGALLIRLNGETRRVRKLSSTHQTVAA